MLTWLQLILEWSGALPANRIYLFDEFSAEITSIDPGVED
jgi:hypothetical protein